MAFMDPHWVISILAGATFIFVVLLICCRPPGRHGAADVTPPPSRIEVKEVMASIPAISYQRQKCRICGEPFQNEDTCSVLPACTHTFHKHCLARCLRKRLACPICKQALPMPSAQHGNGNLNAAENMV